MRRFIVYLLSYLIILSPITSAWAWDARAFLDRAGVSPEGLVLAVHPSGSSDQTMVDSSGHGNHLDQPVVANQAAIGSAVAGRKAFVFNGTTDYVPQEEIDDETGMTLLPDGPLYILADGSAASQLPGTATDYISTPATHYIVWKDSAGDAIAWGYPRVQDAALSNTDIVVDDMSADNTAQWSKAGSTLTFDTDHYVIGRLGADTSPEIYNAGILNPAFTTGKLYRMSVDVRDGTASGAGGYLTIYTVGITPVARKYFTTTADWQTVTFYHLAKANSDYSGVNGDDFGAGDNIHLRNFKQEEITNLGTTAAHIFSTPTGATQNWTGTGSGDVNDPSTLEIYKVLWSNNLTADQSHVIVYEPDDGQPAASQPLFAKDSNAAGTYGIVAYLEDTGKLRIYETEDGTNLESVVTDAAVYADGVQTSFSMDAFVIDKTNGTGAIYHNGSSVASTETVTAGTIFDTYRPFEIGSRNTGSYLSGKVVIHMIFDGRTLTAAEVQRIYLQWLEDQFISMLDIGGPFYYSDDYISDNNMIEKAA